MATATSFATPRASVPVAIPSRSSMLDTATLTAWLRSAYGFETEPACRLISSSLSDTFEVVVDGNQHFLRAYRQGWRTASQIDAEIRIVQDLAEHGLPVARPLPRADGSFVTPILAAEGERFLILWERAPGDDVRDITPAQARSYGELAARLHDAWDGGESYDRFVLDEGHLLDEPLVAIVERFGHVSDCADDLAYLRQVVEMVRSRLAALPRFGADWGLCHGDLHAGNVRFTADRPTLFDFDCSGYGWRAYDLTVFHWNVRMERRSKRWREQRWRAFLRGYSNVRQLPEGLHDTLPFFLIARTIWLLGLDCAGKSAYPPQWVNPDTFRQTIGFIRGWNAEYALDLPGALLE